MSTYRKYNMTRPPEEFTNCPSFLDNYLKYMSDFSQKSPATVIEAFSVLKEMLQYFHFIARFHSFPSTGDAHKDLDISIMPISELADLQEDDISGYISFLESKVLNSGTTIYKKLCYIRPFFSYLERNARDLSLPASFRSPAENIRLPRCCDPSISILSEKKIQKMISCCPGDSELRDRAIITLLAAVPIQLSDLVRLDRKDVDLTTGTVRVPFGGRQVRQLPMPEACTDAIRAYLMWLDDQLAGDDSSQVPAALFVSGKRNGYYNRLTTRGIQKRITKAVELAGLSSEDGCATALRDTATHRMIQSVRDFDKLSALQMLSFLGYKDPIQAFRRFSGDAKIISSTEEDCFMNAFASFSALRP